VIYVGHSKTLYHNLKNLEQIVSTHTSVNRIKNIWQIEYAINRFCL